MDWKRLKSEIPLLKCKNRTVQPIRGLPFSFGKCKPVINKNRDKNTWDRRVLAITFLIITITTENIIGGGKKAIIMLIIFIISCWAPCYINYFQWLCLFINILFITKKRMNLSKLWSTNTQFFLWLYLVLKIQLSTIGRNKTKNKRPHKFVANTNKTTNVLN